MDKDLKILRERFLSFIEKKWVQNNHSLKDISCVYVIAAYGPIPILTRKDIVYVGSTTQLFSRYKSHKVPDLVQKAEGFSLLYYLPMEKGFYDYEIKLIKRLKPLYNKQHKNGS